MNRLAKYILIIQRGQAKNKDKKYLALLEALNFLEIRIYHLKWLLHYLFSSLSSILKSHS
jgi:hypothetical protein